MRTFMALVLVALLAGGAVWYFTKGKNDPTVQQKGDEIASDAERLKDKITEKIDDFSAKAEVSFDTDKIKEELAKSGRVVRQKAKEAGAAIADATADARVTAAIKAKYVADSDLSALAISVDTTAGVVTLSGSVASHDLIGKAMRLALETDGVKEVVSTLQVREAK